MNIITNITSDKNLPLHRLSLLNDSDKRKILMDYNATFVHHPNQLTTPELLDIQAKNIPGKTALIFNSQTITYREVNTKIDQLAAVIRKKLTRKEETVGIIMTRSLEMVVGIYAILKAGGCYIPISPKNPIDRINYIIEDGNIQLLLVNGIENEFGELPCELINVTKTENYHSSDVISGVFAKPDDLAYIIYTSGSTGRPKGVMIENRSMSDRIHWLQRMYPITTDDILLFHTAFTFDVSVLELMWWPLAGAKLCILEPDGEKYPDVIIETIYQNKVTVIFFTPSVLNVCIEHIKTKKELIPKLKSLKQVFATAEALSLSLVKDFDQLLFQTNGTKLSNLYGPTEITVEASYFDCMPTSHLEKIPIGKPIDNTRLYIVDEYMNLLPEGVKGELCIGGIGLARGYINNPKLTEEKFIPDPFNKGDRLYKTGDWARWLPDGNIEYLGRRDDQVKIRGVRIELGEIETVIKKHPKIRNCVVILRDDVTKDRCIVAYVIPQDDTLDLLEIDRFLRQYLPDYMIPAFWHSMKEYPLTQSKKIDKKNFPKPIVGNEQNIQDPRDETETKLKEVWVKLLKVSSIGINDNFFRVGGHSLLVNKLVSDIYTNFAVNLPLTTIFKYPTIADLSQKIKEAKNTDLINDRYFGDDALVNFPV